MIFVRSTEKMTSSRSSLVLRLVQWRFLIVINFVLIVFLALTLGREFFRSREIQSEINQLQAQADALAARNISLSELQTAMQTESFIEREARLKLGMKKPGEEVVVIQEKKETMEEKEEMKNAADPLNLVLNNENEKIQIANPTKWWYYFFDKKSYKLYAN